MLYPSNISPCNCDLVSEGDAKENITARRLCHSFQIHIFTLLFPPFYLGPIQATSVTYTTVHRNTRSLTHWWRQGIEPATSWILVRFVSSESQWELPSSPVFGGITLSLVILVFIGIYRNRYFFVYKVHECISALTYSFQSKHKIFFEKMP